MKKSGYLASSFGIRKSHWHFTAIGLVPLDLLTDIFTLMGMYVRRRVIW
jgi:hypothetical protein